jgi:osmotically-inducible protein OsmY
MNNALQTTPFAIGENINQLLVESQMTGVSCQCVGSLVVLRGKVNNKNSKDQAASIARRCCGMINEISNEIQIVC